MKQRLLISVAVCLLIIVVVSAGLRSVSLMSSTQAQPFAGTVYCNQSKVYDTNTNGSTTLVPTSASTSSGGAGGGTYVCGYTISTITTTTVKLVYGTQTTTPCDTNPVALTPGWQFQSTTTGIATVTELSSNDRGLVVPAGKDLCINTSAGNSVQAVIYFFQFH